MKNHQKTMKNENFSSKTTKNSKQPLPGDREYDFNFILYNGKRACKVTK